MPADPAIEAAARESCPDCKGTGVAPVRRRMIWPDGREEMASGFGACDRCAYLAAQPAERTAEEMRREIEG